ncbi:MAG: DNA-directed RNA polymerase subunit omega [Bacteroidales bacterium]|nr:DNA-directed RNA polymerase subunit omega [Bacteroidales bacterium]
MDYKKIKTDTNAVTRDITHFDEQTGNIYESVAIIAKRANQIAMDMKEELNQKIEEFGIDRNAGEEAGENKEQIDLVRHYEMLPKPTLMAVQEFMNKDIYFREAEQENR